MKILNKTKILFAAMAASFVINVNAAEIVTQFDPAAEGLPEAIAVDYEGNLYTSMGRSVRKITPEGDLLDVFPLPVTSGLGSGDLVVSWQGDIFVASGGDTIEEKGIWRISKNGNVSKFADFDPASTGFLNGVTMDCYDNLYVSDSQNQRIYRITPEGEVSVWLDDESLSGDGSVLGFAEIGVNNLVIDRAQRHIYASNLDQGTVLKIRIRRDGSAGKIKVFAQDPVLKGIDGITFNRRGVLFAAINATNKIVKINRRGKVKVIEDGESNAEANLDFPSDVVFGKGRDSFTLFISNFAAFEQRLPGVVKIEKKRRRK